MANDGGRIGVTELLVGVPFPALPFEIMRHVTAPRFFNEAILSGATVPAEVAAHRGWVNEAVEPALVMERAIAAAQSLVALSPQAFAQTKMQIRAAVAERYERSGEATDKAATDIWAAPETLTYIRAYVARTFKKS
jgi:enoyl-CoA hydratase